MINLEPLIYFHLIAVERGLSCTPTDMANSSKNFWKRKRYPSSSIPVFRESGISSSSEGIKGRKISVEKDGMHSKCGSRECKKNDKQALKPLFEIKKKALDGRRFKELMKFRAKGANANASGDVS